MRYLNDALLVAANAAVNQNSIAIDASLLFQVSVQAVLTGSSPNGTLKLQASNDKIVAANLAADTTPVNWSDIPSATVSVTGTGIFLIPKTEITYQWIRLVYTFASGTGAISANMFAFGQ